MSHGCFFHPICTLIIYRRIHRRHDLLYKYMRCLCEGAPYPFSRDSFMDASLIYVLLLRWTWPMARILNGPSYTHAHIYNHVLIF